MKRRNNFANKYLTSLFLIMAFLYLHPVIIYSQYNPHDAPVPPALDPIHGVAGEWNAQTIFPP